ncbi:hypothetical protein EV356DRAFT_535159 [Viridothelium virens]|uniref:Uncharacterized protein n=1 Tax=Viridothelium virens TaxID=1048519 RepID=A0A6A6H2M0_VIRVR|nr:hypothetical protein EV356DRAFT_535159 [Viridothelium virens]
MDIAEIDEIHDEESLLIDRLNSLVEQFMKQFHELALPLTTFLRENWSQRMKAESVEQDPLSELEKGQIEEVGVKILDDDKRNTDEENAGATESTSDYDPYEFYDEWIEDIASRIR